MKESHNFAYWLWLVTTIIFFGFCLYYYFHNDPLERYNLIFTSIMSLISIATLTIIAEIQEIRR